MSNVRTRALLGVLTLGVAIALSACAADEPTRPAGSGLVNGIDVGDVTLRVGIFTDQTRAQTELTDYFKDTPYKVDWARLNGAGPTVQALYGNAIDLSLGLSDTATPKAAAEAKEPWTKDNAPFKIVALLKPYAPDKYPSTIIAANKSAGINSLADLRGKSYTYNEGGNANASALLALYKAGLTKQDVKVQLLQSDSIASAIMSGAVQAGATSVGKVAPALADGTVKQIATADQVGFPDYVSVTARTGALADPKLDAAIGDFISRATKYHKWSAEHPEEVSKSYQTTQQLTAEQGLQAAHSDAKLIIPVGPQDPGTKVEDDLADLLVKSGFLLKPIDITQFLDGRYSAQINAAGA
ncbi:MULTISPECIES: ABC transporter substrate-binding protein [unclassified Mycobacterium]|uniref:ABC transporter substrate-binding protein n=1 Tax=unclassified Mycobacterium TaxID=2642494 RepID=UPI0029C71BEC|nr:MULTISPECIES: ABC transporter substrate-binding protein [unclassified Mycobacterium]